MMTSKSRAGLRAGRCKAATEGCPTRKKRIQISRNKKNKYPASRGGVYPRPYSKENEAFWAGINPAPTVKLKLQKQV
jgi:hypothetical protein